MFMGTPPELEMAVYTICALTRPEKSCPMKFGNKSFSIKVFDLDGNIGSAYPQIQTFEVFLLKLTNKPFNLIFQFAFEAPSIFIHGRQVVM